MKHSWIPLLWELWAAQALCAVTAMLPGSRFCTYPELLLPGLALSAAVPAAWAFWGLCAELPHPAEPERPLEPVRLYDLTVLLDETEHAG